MNNVLHPSYIPNIAYFVALAKKDALTFEIHDNFQKQTYRNRAYIYGANGLLQLNIPVVHSQKNRQYYRDVKFADNEWRSHHWKSIESAYRTSPFFEYYEDEILPLFSLKTDYILDFNLKSFDIICECLQLSLDINFTESYKKNINTKFDYRHLVNAKKESTIHFTNYTQVFSNKHGFISNLSILDLLFNEGPNALYYLETQQSQ